jgi:hypothetical protein
VPGVGLSSSKHIPEGGRRVVVATPGALGIVGVEFADLLFMADPLFRVWDDPLLEVESREPPPPSRGFKINQLDGLIRAGNARLFGFLPQAYRTSRFEAARLAQLFGLVSLTVPRRGVVERAVRIAWTKVVGGPVPAPSDSPLRVKELAVWHNPVANRRASCLARALAAGDSGVLRERFPDLAARLGERRPQRVLALVEGEAHAEALSTLLPDWLVFAGVEPIGPNRPIAAGAITTVTGVGRLSGDNFDVMLRLDAGVGLPPVPARWLDTTRHEQTPLLLIDFNHRVHPLLRKWGRSRRHAYLAAGWDEAGTDPDRTALERFTALTSNRRHS